MFNLKRFREILYQDLTLNAFAKKFNMTPERVLEIENGEDELKINEMSSLASIAGISMMQLLNGEYVVDPVEMDASWINAEKVKDKFLSNINRQMKSNDSWSNYYQGKLDALKQTVIRTYRKPRIAIIGRSDVGKSHMINTLIGGENIPAEVTPTTSIINYVMHVSDKPAFMKDNVYLFKTIEDELYWDSLRLNDETYCMERTVKSGDYSLLWEYGTREGDMAESTEAVCAVTFVEGEICKNAILMDVPGYGTGDRQADDRMTQEAKSHADVLIYLSIANGFLRGEDIDYLKESINALNSIENKTLNELKPLCNLYVVASQAHTVSNGDLKKANRLLDNGVKRMMSIFPEDYWNDRSSLTGHKYSLDVMRSRFFTFTSDAEPLRAAFIDDLKALLEQLPKVIEVTGKGFIEDAFKNAVIEVENEMASMDNLLVNRELAKVELKRLLEEEPKRLNDHQRMVSDVLNKMEKLRSNSLNGFRYDYNRILSEKNIVSTIKKKGFERKSEDSSLLSSYINTVLESNMKRALQKESQALNSIINEYLKDFEEQTVGKIELVGDLDLDLGFDSKAVFAGGLTGLATFGGLAFWASSLGNLGAYILVAKGVSILSGVGISIAGGTATATAAVASIGGPVTLGIGLALLAAFAMFTALSSSWEEKTAAKLINAYEEQNVLYRYEEVINEFWDETLSAFKKSSSILDKKWHDRIRGLKDTLDYEDPEIIEEHIRHGDDFCNFLMEMVEENESNKIVIVNEELAHGK